ncbi:hypothetical protein AB0G02_11155 [Actinosynnema sp. NPDC023658]|uniref:hypothetical protein n=1 Tax=Actinosynnema sp. NPDC023658 TaxID=3155465 RepID=UPI0033E802AA
MVLAVVGQDVLREAFPARVPDVPDALLRQEFGPGGVASVSVALVMWDSGPAVAEVDVVDTGFPEDEDGGIRLTATPLRNGISYVLALATAIAGARLAAGRVWDETGAAGGARITEPDRLADHLRAPAGLAFDDAVNAVLAATRLGVVWEPAA